MTILDTLRKRLADLEQQGEEIEFIPVTLEELKEYINLYETIDPTYSTDDDGNIIPRFGELPLYCSFRGVPLRCRDAG